MLRYRYIAAPFSLMDLDGSTNGWLSLGDDLQLSILSALMQREHKYSRPDKDSLQAVMQTSRDLRRLASSLISSIEIRDASALVHYPRHAAIKSMRLAMKPCEARSWRPFAAHMEPCCMVTWLQAISSACNRLAAVTIVRVKLPGMPQAIDPATMDSLLASIARACPNLRCLSIEGIMREEDLVRAMFAAIGQHLPRVIELQLELEDGEDLDFAIAAIDWAACLPRSLQKFKSTVDLHHALLQQLVLMPSLTEVEVFSLSYADEGDLRPEVLLQSDACAWRSLRVWGDFPSYLDLARLPAMPLLCLTYDGDPLMWADTAVEGPVMAKAAAWLSQIRNCPKKLVLELSSAAAATTAGLISSLAPLSAQLHSLELRFCPVTERTLDELAVALPNVHELILSSCTIFDSAWTRMVTLLSVTDLTINRVRGGVPSEVLLPEGDYLVIPLAQIIAFVSAISRPMTLTFKGGVVSIEDRAGWEAFKAEQRRSDGLQHITVRFTQEW